MKPGLLKQCADPTLSKRKDRVMNIKVFPVNKLIVLISLFLFCTCPFSAQLNGTFTIPSETYPTINSIVNDINSSGIDGPIEINILDGTYTEYLNFGVISGSSSTNTITFQSQSGNAASVKIRYLPTNPNIDNFVLQFSGTQHFIIKNITLETQGTSWARIISLLNSAGNLVFKNLIFNGHSESIPNNFQSIVYGDDSGTLHNISFEKNMFNSGYYGLFLYPTYSTNLIVADNIFNSDHGGIYLQNCSFPNIVGNNLSVNSNLSGVTILSCLYFSFESNKLNSSHLNTSGISILNSFIGTVVNNFIQVTENGISLDQSEDIEIYFNSINIEDNPITVNNNSSAIKFLSGNSRITIENNIMCNRRDGFSYIGEDGFANVFDYNNLFSSGSNFVKWEGSDYSTLSAFQSSSGTNLNSFSASLNFTSLSDLHITGSYTLLNGISITSYSTDLDGDVRGNPPFMGADEPTYICVDVKVLLEGPYINNSTMSVDLSSSLPLVQPFVEPIHGGSESVSSEFFSQNSDIVDWVVIELRSDEATKVLSRAGFLLNSGEVVDLDGSSPLLFFIEPDSDYYIAVFQRNHFAIMSANPIILN